MAEPALVIDVIRRLYEVARMSREREATREEIAATLDSVAGGLVRIGQ